MNPLFSASYPYILIHSIPNDIYLGTACVLGLFIASVSLRFAYNFADNPRLWNKVETARAMYGLYIARAVSFLSLIAALFLMGRLQYPMERDWWHAQSFNKGNWNIYRLVAAVVLPLTTALFHTHCFFRFYSSFCFAGLALLDMLSQLDLAGLVHCVDVGACYNTGGRTGAYYWMWRDLASTTINICGCVVCWFMWGHFGFCTNEIYVPRYEHRVLTGELNSVRLGRRNVKRHLGDEDFVEW